MNDTEKIAKLNDLARTAMGVASKVYQTSGISALPAQDQSAIREKVEKFNDFTPGNDPYGEHDMGFFEHNGEKIMFKIDLYDPSMQYYTEDPTDTKKTVRVLTILKAEEY